MKNKEIADILYEISELLAIKGENVFKIRAYEKAALNISSLTEDIAVKIKEGEKISGVGESIAEKIKEYLETGKLEYYDNLKKSFPQGFLEIMSVQGVGPKRAKLLYDKLDIKNIDELKKAAEEGKIRNIETLGEKSEQNILKGIAVIKKGAERILFSRALHIASEIIEKLKSSDVIKISEAGSLRRRKETVRDIDILCTSKDSAKVIEKFCSLGTQVLAKGETKSSILTFENVQVDLRIVKENEYGSALQYFTGSQQHNIALRGLAKDVGYKINEYGIFDTKTNKKVGGLTEEEIYNKLGLKIMPPELRENNGEIEASKNNTLPKLLELSDIKGDFHVHTKYSDGNMSIEQIADAAIKLGYEWVGICDHSPSLKVAGGLEIKTLRKKIDEIKEFNENSKNIKLLCGTEVDILSDGKIDYPDEILKELDLVIASIHSGFKQDEKTITNRIVKAMENKYVNSLGHPTGRLINKREPYQVNLEEVIKAAKTFEVTLEINAYPERLDLPDIWCKNAKERNVLLAIGTDSHFIEQLNFMKYGVFVARRGWLEKKDVLNCLNYTQLKKFLLKRR
ncbi:MAG TPA: DNA polymerase/3'-5' exonuclease PolX [Elusimicrobia bacterium]|nr:MAG: DNA polymerase III [Elusimicrobia bacterium RIFOXYD2_FULL_34_30]HAM39235.1 DNA polymerase/3'-5' exonuclease PolX [Elusimicrobiota bacterium]